MLVNDLNVMLQKPEAHKKVELDTLATGSKPSFLLESTIKKDSAKPQPFYLKRLSGSEKVKRVSNPSDNEEEFDDIEETAIMFKGGNSDEKLRSQILNEVPSEVSQHARLPISKEIKNYGVFNKFTHQSKPQQQQ